MRNTFEVPELPITGFKGEHYATFRRRLFDRFDKAGKYTEDREDKLGRKLGIDENDLWLAAQACERNLILVTGDAMERIREIVDGDIRIEIWPEK